MVSTRLGKRARGCTDIWGKRVGFHVDTSTSSDSFEEDSGEPERPATRRRTNNAAIAVTRKQANGETSRRRYSYEEEQENSPTHHTRDVGQGDQDSDEEDTIIGPYQCIDAGSIPHRARTSKVNIAKLAPDHEPTPPTTPHKQRRIDVLGKNTPSTPKHRVTITGLSLTPRTPKTPKTPSSSATAVYSLARKVFSRGADAGPMVGRATEKTELERFLTGNISTRKGGCIYVSGPPGTGKSAAVQEVCSAVLGPQTELTHIAINCMSINSSTELFATLLSYFAHDADLKDSDKEPLVQTYLSNGATGGNLTLLVLDEVDHLLHLDLNAVYKLFEWSMSSNSRLLVVGIANALDMTDRFLPRLKARNLKPTLLPFLPYVGTDIASVLTSRARSLLPPNSDAASAFTPFLHPMAIQLISKKVAAQTGDIRKAFDIAQRCIDLIESETRQKVLDQTLEQRSPSRTPLSENPNLSSPPSSQLSPVQGAVPSSKVTVFDPITAPRATVAHVVKATATTFGNGTTQRLKALNLQQKAILCALVVMEEKLRNEHLAEGTPQGKLNSRWTDTGAKKPGVKLAAPAIRDLYETYGALCKRDNLLQQLSNVEFRDVVGNLETLGLVSDADGRGGSFAAVARTPSKKGRATMLPNRLSDERRISARTQMQELEAVAQGPGSDILLTILRGDL